VLGGEGLGRGCGLAQDVGGVGVVLVTERDGGVASEHIRLGPSRGAATSYGLRVIVVGVEQPA
jgi:hypothetical protein